jgi:ABC-type nitrate/sulfonate/bicarbonate transport system substrate-binding protein
MKKNLILMLGVVMLTFGCNSNTKKTATAAQSDGMYKVKIKVGHLVALDMAPLFIAKEKGYFKANGLDLETVFFANPGDNNAALAGGSIKFSINPFTLPYFGVNSGINMKIISGAGGLGIIEVIIQGNYPVNSVKDLVAWIKSHPGQKLKIAVLKGDTLEMIVQKMLADNGLTYDDVQMVWFNDLLAMVQAFQTKQVDILSHIKPYTTDMVVNHHARSFVTSSEVWGMGTPNCTVSVLDDFADKYPGTVKGYLKAVNQAFHFIVDHPDQAADILTKGNYYKVDKSVLLYALEHQPKIVMLKPNEPGMMNAINALVKMNYIKKPQKEIIDTSYIHQLDLK